MLENLDNLQPAPKVDAPVGWRPAVEFDGAEGTATTNGFEIGEKPNFDEFLKDRGYDPAEYEVDGNSVRTSQWQVASPWPAEPRWLTSYRFHFKKRTGPQIDLPLLYSQAKKKARVSPVKATESKALVVLFSDLQLGKSDHRGGTEQVIERLEGIKQRLVAQVKKEKPTKIVFCDVGDIIESFSNAADMAQLASNDLSLMGQIDLATTIVYDFLKTLAALVPDVTYATVASNHCQNRINKQRVGKPGQDDWGTFIGRSLARLSSEMGLPIRFIEPQPHDESLAHDVFGDGFHILGLWHGHQSNRPEGVPSSACAGIGWLV